jgi:hypothetical protein
LDGRLVYRWIAVNVYRNSTARLTTTRQLRDIRAEKRFSADYHQKSWGKTVYERAARYLPFATGNCGSRAL